MSILLILRAAVFGGAAAFIWAVPHTKDEWEATLWVLRPSWRRSLPDFR